MFKTTFKIITPIILVVMIIAISYNTYKKTEDVSTSPITIIPTNASIILQINDIKNLKKSLKKSVAWNQLQNIQYIHEINKQINILCEFLIDQQTFFVTNKLFISLHKVSPKKNAALFGIPFDRNKIKENKDIISLFGTDITISKYDNKTIYFNKSLNKYFSFKNNVLFYSSEKMLVTDAIRISNKESDNLFSNKSFSNCYKTISKSADINLLINYNNLLAFSDVFIESSVEQIHFSEWTATDVRIKNNSILANGLSTNNNSVNNFTDIFKNQKSQNLKIIEVIPHNTTQLFAITFNKPKQLYDNKNEILRINHDFRTWDIQKNKIEDSLKINYTDLLTELENEAGIFNTSSNLSTENTYTYIKTKESIIANSLLQSMITSSSILKGFQINEIADKNLTYNLFGPTLKANNRFFTTIDDYFIFGHSIVALEYVIDNFISQNTLSNNKSFKKLNSYISNSANIFLYINPGKTALAFREKIINKETFRFNADSIAKFTAFSMQINNTKNGMLHNLCLFYDEKYKESIKEEWYYPLDTISNINPQFIENHFTKEKMILIQDNLNNLISLNTSGEKLWSKSLKFKILGKINFIDFYNNNKYQALFNTKDQLHLIDRNGKYVDGFPKNLPISTSLGHTLIDYDNNKKYRIMIVGDDNMIYNIDKKGENVNGWKYKKTKNNINKSPIHFVVNGKDYILKATNNSTTKLLARNGKDRVTFSEYQDFINPVKVSKNGTLYSITSQNKMWTGYVNGTTKIIDNPKVNAKSKILLHNDGFYVTNKNVISYIHKEKSKEINITLNGLVKNLSYMKGYIAITTESSIYLIKNNKIVEGFPIDSDGLFNIGDIDNNGKVNLVNIKKGCVYNYELAN